MSKGPPTRWSSVRCADGHTPIEHAHQLLYVDKSNMWIEGVHVSAVQIGLAPDIWSAQDAKICDYGWEIDFGRLFKFAGEVR